MAHFIPTERDKEVLNWMLRQIRNIPVNSRTPLTVDTGLPIQPGVGAYIAKVPENGIPRMEQPGTGTGTDEPQEPGSVLCEIYKISDMVDGGNEELRKYPSLKKRVYNITTSDVTAEYVLVTQLADGKWISVPPNDRWEFGKMTTDALEGPQAPDTTFADITKGPANNDEEVGEDTAIDYVKGGDLVVGDIVTLSWKYDKVYALPWECDTAGTTGTGTIL